MKICWTKFNREFSVNAFQVENGVRNWWRWRSTQERQIKLRIYLLIKYARSTQRSLTIQNYYVGFYVTDALEEKSRLWESHRLHDVRRRDQQHQIIREEGDKGRTVEMGVPTSGMKERGTDVMRGGIWDVTGRSDETRGRMKCRTNATGNNQLQKWRYTRMLDSIGRKLFLLNSDAFLHSSLSWILPFLAFSDSRYAFTIYGSISTFLTHEFSKPE